NWRRRTNDSVPNSRGGAGRSDTLRLGHRLQVDVEIVQELIQLRRDLADELCLFLVLDIEAWVELSQLLADALSVPERQVRHLLRADSVAGRFACLEVRSRRLQTLLHSLGVQPAPDVVDERPRLLKLGVARLPLLPQALQVLAHLGVYQAGSERFFQQCDG